MFHAKLSIIAALTLAWLTGCHVSPSNGTQLDNAEEPVPFIAATPFPGDPVTFQMKRMSNGSWRNLRSTQTATDPTAVDGAGVNWYAAGQSLSLPMSNTMWANAPAQGHQRRIRAEVRTSSDNWGLLTSFDSNDSCAGDVFVDEGGMESINQCSSQSSPAATVFLNCGKAGQACCFAASLADQCDEGRTCRDGRCQRINTSLSSLKGKTTCLNGVNRDCNACVWDVESDLAAIDRGQVANSRQSWDFDWRTSYPPHDLEGIHAFDGPKKRFEIPYDHIQGFVRTSNPRYPFVGTHSMTQYTTQCLNPSSKTIDCDDPANLYEKYWGEGTAFVLQSTPDGLELRYLINAGIEISNSGAPAGFQSDSGDDNVKHPSGAGSVGQYVVYGVGRGYYHVLDTSQRAINAMDRGYFRVKKPNGSTLNAGGGIDLVELEDGGYLMVIASPGGEGDKTRKLWAYRVKGSLGDLADSDVEYLGQWTKPDNHGWENLSLVTECGTGDIHVITTSGEGTDFGGGDGLDGSGWIEHGKLTYDGSRLRVDGGLNRRWIDQDIRSCHLRSSATFDSTNTHRMTMLCHERYTNYVRRGSDFAFQLRTAQ